MTETLTGLVVKAQSGFLVVRTGQGDYTCRLRGRLKKGSTEGDVVAVGDHVRFQPQEDGTGSIEEVLPRHSLLSRQLSGIKYDYQQILLANPDQLVFVFACARPEPHLRLLDRFLVVAESQNLPAIIVANKVDLVDRAQAEQMFGLYERLGYDLLYTSTKTKQGIEALRQKLIGKISAFAGPSGVGKSSLLNEIQPELGLEVRSVSLSTTKGRHTTQVRELFALDEGGYVADMPGLRTLALWDIEGEELDAYFREMRDLVPNCQFSNCTHSHEPGCAVRAAVESGQVDQRRYDSYLRLRFGGVEEDDEEIAEYPPED